MGIERFFTKTFTYKRMVWSNESSSEVSQGTFKGHLQQAKSEIVESLGSSFTKTFSLWCAEDIDLEEQDKISDGTYNYIVHAVNNKDYGEMNPHLQLIVERLEIT